MPDPNRNSLDSSPARQPVPQTLAAPNDAAIFEPSHRRTRGRPTIAANAACDAPVADARARLMLAAGGAHAILAADPPTRAAIAHDNRGAMRARPAGRPAIRRDPHPGLGLPAAASRVTEPARPRSRTIATHWAQLSTLRPAAAAPHWQTPKGSLR
jgi:hypothetical protein